MIPRREVYAIIAIASGGISIMGFTMNYLQYYVNSVPVYFAANNQQAEVPDPALAEYNVYMVARSTFAHEVLVELMKKGLQGSNIEYYTPTAADHKSLILYDAENGRPTVADYTNFIGIYQPDEDGADIEGTRVNPPGAVCMINGKGEDCSFSTNPFSGTVGWPYGEISDDSAVADDVADMIIRWLKDGPIYVPLNS